MRSPFACALIVVALSVSHLQRALCQDDALLVPKMAKRDKSSSNGGSHNDDFEKFFLKASKSVPRIGRRRIEDQASTASEIKVPLWADLADLYEYNPELFSSPQLLARYLAYYNSQLSADEAKLFDEGGWTTLRYKRTRCPDNYATSSNSHNDELHEYRLQP